MTYYDLLGIDPSIEEELIADAAERGYNEKAAALYQQKVSQEITYDEYRTRLAELKTARDTLVDTERRREYDESVFEFEDEGNERRKGKGIALKVGAVAVAAAIAIGLFVHKDDIASLFSKTGADSTGLDNKVTVEETYQRPEDETLQYTDPTESNDKNQGAEQGTVVNYGDIYDAQLLDKRATQLVQQLSDANIINPVTVQPYTKEEIVGLIQYANGVYVPSSIEEIDVMHLNLLNLFISPLNTDPYLFHVVYANGNDDFRDMAVAEAKNVKPVDFASAFSAYGQNGVYPLSVWIQAKREQIYTTTDRTEIDAIFQEVGQVMADIMKGNGCTITVLENGKPVTYTFTSEQILANHASAMLLTTEAQLIFANRYELRDENNKVVKTTNTTWEVNNKFNDENPDHVTLEEIEAWINNGCDYEWAIDDVLINGQTFGQRIQGDMEGMAQNNYAMTSENRSLTK